MLRKKYRWAYTGVTPNYWVKQVGGSANLSDNFSSGLHTEDLSSKNTCVVDTNDDKKYEGYIVEHGPYGCSCSKTSGDKYTFDNAAANAPYSKELREPETSGQYTSRIRRDYVLKKQVTFDNPKCIKTTSHKI